MSTTTTVAPNCSVTDPLSLPAPKPISIDCQAGIVVNPPPPPPPPKFVLLRIKEEGPVKQFATSNLPYGSENWVLGVTGFPDDLPFGEKVLMPFGGGSISVPGCWYRFLQPNYSPIYGEILLGNRNGPRKLAPSKPLKHLPNNSVYIRIPGVWHGISAPLELMSYRPFRATCCLTNTISGLPQYTQMGIPAGNGVGIGDYSPFYDIFSGGSVKLVIEEYNPLLGN